ncbi:MAG: hypothetical protein K2M60_10370 [Lachnospiraceae bacterium]|nr:hypothetical protein [Lachnospiraceae bacterium]MDE6251044.1 hypothetical protein [Lachnospiraceae bacterium]
MAGKISVGVAGSNGAAGGSGQNNINNNTQQNSTYNKQTIERIDSEKVFNVKKDGGNNNQISDDAAEYQDEAVDPINMATGKFICEDTDYSLPDTNGDYLLIRKYTTEKDRRNKSLGRAWTFNADTHMTLDGDTVTVTMSDAKTAEFIKTGNTYTNKKAVQRNTH